MSDQPQKFNGGEYVDKARDAAREHPDQARSAIDKVQDAVNQRTGGQFESMIDKAGDFVEDTLGLPEETKGEPQDSQPTPSEPTEPAPPQEPRSPEPPDRPQPPSQPQEPTRVPAPESGQSGTPDTRSASTGEGKLPG